MRRLLSLVLLVGFAFLAWQYRDSIRAVWRDVRRVEAAQVPSAELAGAAQAKLAVLSDREASERVALTEAELQSLLQYRIASFLPAYIVAPRVELKGGRIRILAQVPTERFPRVEELGEVMGFLPDTTEVAVTGQLIPLGRGRVGLAVDEVTAARIPLPRGLVPTMLQRLGRKDEPGLPPDAIALPLPAGAAGAYVRGDSLVFVPRSDPSK